MILNKNQKEFPSDLHREIWQNRISLTSSELSNEYLDNETWSMFKDLHDFLLRL